MRAERERRAKSAQDEYLASLPAFTKPGEARTYRQRMIADEQRADAEMIAGMARQLPRSVRILAGLPDPDAKADPWADLMEQYPHGSSAQEFIRQGWLAQQLDWPEQSA